MHTFKRTTLITATLVAVASFAVADEKLDQIEKEIVAKWKSVKSMSAKMNMDMQMDQGGMKMKSNMAATVEYLRKGETMMSRMEGAMKTEMDTGGEPQTMDMPMLSVSDGSITHTLVEQMGQKMCMKSKTKAHETAGDAMFKALREQNTLTVKPDEDVDGDACWVIEGTPKQRQGPQEAAKTAYYFRQKDAAMMQMVGYDDAGNKFMTMKMSDVKVNEKIDPERFEFKVPEGVQVMDMTGGAP